MSAGTKNSGANNRWRYPHARLIFALFSHSFRPMGFWNFMVAQVGSPYFGNQYFERLPTYVNAYSMLAPSVKAFVRAATGEIEFGKFSPFAL